MTDSIKKKSEQPPVDPLDRARIAVRKDLEKAKGRTARRRAAILRDLARGDESPALRALATILLSNLSRIPAGATSVELDDFSSDPPTPRTIAIDAQGPQSQAQRLFALARRYDRGTQIARPRLVATEADLLQLEALLETIATSDAQALSEARDIAIRLGHMPRQQRALIGKEKKPERLPYRSFRIAHDRWALVGRGASDNDALTLRRAKPRDIFLHVRGHAGAHVIIPVHDKSPLDPEALIDAAHLAVHFSSARGERFAEVVVAARRFVRKKRGAAPGSVSLDREKTIPLRVDADRLARLLLREDLAAKPLR